MLYMVTFTTNIPQMLVYIPYMDPMGMYNNCASHKSYIGILLSTSTNQHQHSSQNTNASSLFDGLTSCCSNHTTPGTNKKTHIICDHLRFNWKHTTLFLYDWNPNLPKKTIKKLVNVGRFGYVSKVVFGLQMAPADTFHLWTLLLITHSVFLARTPRGAHELTELEILRDTDHPPN